MKIVFIGGRDIHILGGIESYMYNLATQLVKMGHEPIVFFIEFKRSKTGAVSTQQHKWRTLLFQAGFKTYFVDSDEKFEAALKAEGVW